MSLLNLKKVRSKVAFGFIIFGLVFAIEGAIVIIFWNSAAVVSRQIDLAQEAFSFNQSAQISFMNFLTGTHKKLSGEEANQFNQARTILGVLHDGGAGGAAEVNIDPVSGPSLKSLNELIELGETNRKNMVEYSSLKISIDSIKQFAKTDSASAIPINNDIQDSYKKIAKGVIESEGLQKIIAQKFNQLVKSLHKEEDNRQAQLAWIIGIIVFTDMCILGYFFWLMAIRIFKPIEEIAHAASQREFSKTSANDELGMLANTLNDIIKQLNNATEFINATGKGNLDFTLKSDTGSQLAKALVGMQQQLKSINEEEERRKWANEGLALFVEILRSGESDLKTIGDKIIAQLVSYTQSTQGGLYVYNNDDADPNLELIASYAYDRKKYSEKSIKPGEGLLGQTFLEQQTTYLEEIPHNYFKVVSGLGEIDPQSILIVPLLSDNKVYGMVELASLKKFKDHEIKFVERIGESVASTLASVQTNEKNKKLLIEMKFQTESLQAQEEEMRQNMEELTATQEEMVRKEKEYLNQIDDLKTALRNASADGQWKLAAETHEALQVNLAALESTLSGLSKKQ